MLHTLRRDSHWVDDSFDRLRYILEEEAIDTARLYSPARTRTELFNILYKTFWGSHAKLFLPSGMQASGLQSTLYEVQSRVPSNDPPKAGRSCGHIFQKGECCYRCKDCARDDSSVMCSKCFHATQHEGHNITFYISHQPGGCCDCGDAEPWRIRPNCPFHSPAEPPEPNGGPPNLAKVINVWAPEKNASRASVPVDLRETMTRTIAYVLDYILNTLDYAPDDTTPPKDTTQLSLVETSDPARKDVFTVILWNDDKHSFDEVINNVCEATGGSRFDISHMVDRIDDEGREIVETDANAIRILDIGIRLHQIDLGITIRRGYDALREQVCAILIEWLLDLTRCKLGSDAYVLRELVTAELLAPRVKGGSISNLTRDSAKGHIDTDNPARLDWLFLYHARLWKKPRLNLKQIYVSIITLGHEYKIVMASRFASIYHRIIDSFLLVDREGETSVKYFALQLFSVPSVAAHIVRHHGIIPRLLAIITAFFTEQISGSRIVFPPNPNCIVDPESKAFKSKRFMPVFNDLRCLVASHTVQSLICQNSAYISGFSKICQMFMGIHPNVRATISHIEYESETWINVFNVTLSLSRVIKAYGEAYCKATTAQLVEAIGIVIHHILVVCKLQEHRLDSEKYSPITSHYVEFGEKTYQVIDFDCLSGAISFHHGLHWLLAELLKHVDILSTENLKAAGLQNLRDIIFTNRSELDVLTLIDFPLRALVMVAQIRTGLWVRNGFAMRGQLLHYRDFMLRELCYDQDIFLLQTALCVLSPGLILTSMLDRFRLVQWFSGNQMSSTYDGPQVSNMVEEFLYVLITCLSEPSNAQQFSMRDSIRRELVHALATGPCGFSEICKRMAERMLEDVCFESVLNEVATYKPPRSTVDSGLYELRDECFDEVNPYFFHYSKGKRDEVEPILKARLKKRDKIVDPIITPKPLNVKIGPFTTLTRVFQDSTVLQIIFFTIFNVVNQSNMTLPTAEAILDQGLHLVMLGIVEQPRLFSTLAAHTTYEMGAGDSLIDLLCSLEHNNRFRSLKLKVEWCLDQFSQFIPSTIIQKRQIFDDRDNKVNLEEKKKRAAKARQAAIMKQFAAAQNAFLNNIDEAEDDEVMEEDATSVVQAHGPCLVCQEPLDAAQPWGMLGFIQAAKFVRQAPDHSTAHVNDVLASAFSLDKPAEPLVPPMRFPAVYVSDSLSSPFNGFPRQYVRFGMHAGGCGHMMHLTCFSNYILSIRQRHRMQAQRNHPENLHRKEFICPLCKSLGNIIIPVEESFIGTTLILSLPDWVRTTGISLLRSAPDRLLESLHFKSGSGEFVFWTAQDAGYVPFPRHQDRVEPGDTHKMVDTVMTASRLISSQSRHLRDRIEQDHGERGIGMYLPEELIGYTLSCFEISLRGIPSSPDKTVADQLTDQQESLIRGLVACLTKLAALQFKDRPDGGREAIRQAIVKRLLPEWRRESAFNSPLLLRDPIAILVETAAVAPDNLRYVTILTYYACLARTTIGLVQLLNKCQSMQTLPVTYPNHADIFRDIGTFVMSAVRHSSLLEHTAEVVLETFGEEKFAKFLHSYSLPFLRRAILLRKAIYPSSLYPLTSMSSDDGDEYRRLLHVLGIPPLSKLSGYDTIQNALSGWCAHYGYLHASHPLECIITLDFPIVYQLAQLPHYLDDMFGSKNTEMTCTRCHSVPSDPAICLLCGFTVCFQSHCCVESDGARERGECNVHTRDCGGVIGAYFVPKRCCIVYLFVGNGSFASAPYLDVHGEVDFSMRRGRRQCLHDVRFEEIRRLWLNHGIPTFIARKLEATIDTGGWDQL